MACVTLWMIDYLEWYLPWIILCEIVVFVYLDFEVCFCSPTYSTLVLSRSIILSSTCLLSVVLTCWERSLAKVWSLGLVSNHRNTVSSHFCYMFTCCHFYYRLQIPLVAIHIICILLSLRRTSAPIQLTIVLCVLGTQETSCILIAGLLERG